MRAVAGLEFFAVPVGVEALCDLVDFVLMSRDDGVVARLGHILGLPIERLDEGGGVIDNHRLLMRYVEGGIAVADADATVAELFTRIGLFFFTFSPLGIEHDAHA